MEPRSISIITAIRYQLGNHRPPNLYLLRALWQEREGIGGIAVGLSICLRRAADCTQMARIYRATQLLIIDRLVIACGLRNLLMMGKVKHEELLVTRLFLPSNCLAREARHWFCALRSLRVNDDYDCLGGMF